MIRSSFAMVLSRDWFRHKIPEPGEVGNGRSGTARQRVLSSGAKPARTCAWIGAVAASPSGVACRATDGTSTWRTRRSWHHLLRLETPAARVAIGDRDRVAGPDLHDPVARHRRARVHRDREMQAGPDPG